jgi:hypothetical protein
MMQPCPLPAGYRPVVAPQSHEVVQVAPMVHHVVRTPPEATQGFNKARWIPVIVLVVLFVLSPYFMVIALVIYSIIFATFMMLGWLGGRRQ